VVLSFTGEHTQKVDGKGRMSIPADFRRVLEAGDPEWAPGLSPRIRSSCWTSRPCQLLPRGSANKKKLSRLIIGQSIKLDVDKDGRTVMPIKQRQKLGLTDGELTFSGLGDHFEIWKAETFSAIRSSCWTSRPCQLLPRLIFLF